MDPCSRTLSDLPTPFCSMSYLSNWTRLSFIIIIWHTCRCCKYQWYSKKNTSHSWERVNYIFPGDCDTTTRREIGENGGYSTKKTRKRPTGVTYGATCKTSLDFIVKCDVDLVTSFHIVVGNQWSVWNHRKNVEFVSNDQLQLTTETLLYIYVLFVFILISSYGQEIIYRQWGSVFEVFIFGVTRFVGGTTEG